MYVYIFRLSMESLPCRRFLIKGVTIFFRKCVDVVFAHKEYKSIISFVKKGVKCTNKNNLMINKVVQQTIIFFPRRKYSWFFFLKFMQLMSETKHICRYDLRKNRNDF